VTATERQRGLHARRRSYREGVVSGSRSDLARPLLRVALVLFVLAWILGPYALRTAVPLWLVFLVALGLELQFFLGALRPAAPRSRERVPQAVDVERYGYGDEREELLLVRRGDEELWIPYRGETGEELEALIAEAAEPEEEVEVEWVEARRELWPTLRRSFTGLAFLAALAALVWVVDERSGWDALDAEVRAEASERFSGEASLIADKQVTIVCDESGDYVGAVQHADGVATVGGELAYLAPERCLDLYRLAFRDEVRSSQTARALAVLAHEAWHLRGVRDEGTTECYALQSAVELGRRLGLEEDDARRLMRQQLVENTLRSGGSAEYLVPPSCRDGGELDLDPRSKTFP
jgi:hypothetical protein